MKTISIDSRVSSNGFLTTIDEKKIQTTYPKDIWDAVPKKVRQNLAQSATYFATRHLVLSRNRELSYQFPPPSARLFFDYGYLYSMAALPIEFPKKNAHTNDIVKNVYNGEFFTKFHGIPYSTSPMDLFMPTPKQAIIPMSLGKDSLLTFALSRELGLTTNMIFMEEPTCPYQNHKKHKLIKDFNKEFSVDILRFPNQLGLLRESDDVMWGWDMLILQYTTLLLPYVYATKPQYLFWSNEQSTSEYALGNGGYIANASHEQSDQWVLMLNNLYRTFAVNTVISSLIEPVHELFILSILHKRYPEVGKYQLSCDGETGKHRWCGTCFECARVYVFLTALGIDPKSVGIMDNMLNSNTKDLFYFFTDKDDKKSIDAIFEKYPERLLSFYLAHKRGAKGAVMEEFEKRLLPYVKKQKEKLIAKYFGIYDMNTIPAELQKPLKNIYQEERKRLRKELSI